MASTKIDGIWQLLSTYKFGNDIPENYHCIICRKVAIEPYTALCECTFCSECIKEYLKDGRKHCPGIKNDCAEEYLEIDRNVSKDIRAIRNIGLINVKCPNEMCEERCDLENMNYHVKVCSMTKIKCPYENIGGQLRQISGDNEKTHYDNEWFSNLRNDADELKKFVEKRDEEINKLNEDSVAKEMTIKEMRIDIDILREINESKDREMEEMKDEFRMMKETQKKTMMEELENVKKDIVERDLNKNILINEIKQQVDDQRREIEELKIKDEQRDREMEVMKETQQKQMMEELEILKRDIVERDVREDIEDQRTRLNDLRVNQESIEREINSVRKVKETKIFDEREFIWRVNDFSKMREDRQTRRVILWRYSFKLYFYLWCDGDYLGFCCRILKGEFDTILKWPMKHKITLSLINQAIMKSHKSLAYRHNSFAQDESVFNKPKDKWNEYFGECEFSSINEITDTPGLLINDSLIVSLNIDY